MIHLGYEIGTGKRVPIPLGHMIVLGQTQKSGKTTTLEALTTRSGVCAIAFITKRGEKSFRLARTIPPFYSETSETQPYWKFVISIIESAQDIKLGFREKGWIMELCSASSLSVSAEAPGGKKKRDTYSWKEPKTLRDVLSNAEIVLAHSKGVNKMICRQLVEYLKIAVPEIERAKLSNAIELKPGINVMDISKLSMNVQALIIRSVVEWVYLHRKNTVVIIPEAWKFLPEYHTTPVSGPVMELIRQGAVIGNFVWIDLQDLRGIQKMLLRSIQVWLFGVQREKNEVENTLRSMPTPECKPTAQEMMQLKIGQFLVAYDTEIYRTYVQPAGMEDEHARAIALGEESPESWTRIVRSLDAETESVSPNHADDSDGREAGGGVLSETEDEMYKEKYEALQLEHQQLVETHDAMAKRLKQLEERLGTLDRALTMRARPAAEDDTVFDVPGLDRQIQPGLMTNNGNGDLEKIYRYIVDRAAKDPEPAIVSLLVERPELMINISRRKIEIDGTTLRGFLAALISEKFFDAPKNGNQAFQEAQRRGRRTAKPNVYRELDGLAELGFLTKEDSGYQAVAGMKVNILEAHT